MKNVKMTICIVTAVLAMAAGQGFGLTEFKDGGTYNIDYAISDNVSVDAGESDMQTIFNLLSGGTIASPYLLQGYNKCTLNIAGGTVYELHHHGTGTITISAGTVNNLYASNVYSSQQITITGGQVDYLNDGVCSITISGGSVGTLSCDGNGGSIAGIITIIGSNFAINGVSVDYGEYFKSDYSSGTLTGTLANGDVFSTYFTISKNASITLVPEPATICLFAFAGLLIRNKK